MLNDNSEFVKSMENATLRMIQEAAENMKKACLVVERDAKKNCPVDQGILRASMQYDVSVTTAEIVGTVSNGSEYAPYVHQGTGIYAKDGNGRKTPWKYEVKKGKYKGWHITKGQKPQPFLDKAKLDNKNKILKILAGE
ncbi:HK97 gp10 family phage protein [Clostridium cadaveris]|uniref:HK97-gp10 family putative phage morphogenesis protein n=1 Tax=Clostridium cadaveris TaxID=1529 RepID=UPI0025A4030C|nr:HK97-gp10 family putative phage morphogenesis protein [Clostridium cadaveris]MDM8312905.1 HK97 gp10 family phage protein [Clostridium cadaveris]